MDEIQSNALKTIRLLLGKWRGAGTASFPTTATFEYREELEFTANEAQPFLRYEERTWKKLESGEHVPSQWETGFWRALPSGDIELVSAQGSGRMEILRGRLQPAPDGFALHLRSSLVTNDARMERTERRYSVRGNRLTYEMHMSTTAVPILTRHVQAELEKESA